MSFIEVNGANLYYQTYGKAMPGRAPILLIHGSTHTGQRDWGLIVPLLERYGLIIVPDCRGHGRSENPGRSYSFREMASDMAALVRALGYPRAHIIGHSNGGNVALVTLMEHPEVVQTAILQAANAYVSADLLVREPPLFDPQGVERESPEWMNEMISLHSLTHGLDYWRELLQLTLKEIISEPNYTPEALGRVQRPTLVIQGEKDPVNAPSRHAQFIARYIPDAELWIPAGIAHNVHVDLACAWVERVLDFIERRGDELNDSLYRLGRLRYPDRRMTVFDLRVQVVPKGSDDPDIVNLCGEVLDGDQRDAAIDCLASSIQYTSASISTDEMLVLMDETTPWALVTRPVEDLRREPRITSERVSQILLGEAVRVLEEQGDWCRVRLEHDGYLGWAHTAALHPCSRSEVAAYQVASQARVVAELLPANLHESKKQISPERPQAGKLPFGVRLPVEKWDNGQALVRLPDGSLWWVASSGLLQPGEQPQPEASGIDFTLKQIQRFVGVPYLWGGRTPYGFDCSGLAQAFWSFMGVNIPRDADQQYRAGLLIDGDHCPGDLLFFGERDADEPHERFAAITHVAISLGDAGMIHANGSAWSVSYNSLKPGSPLYRAWLHEHLAGVRRFA